jgi:hypothetical protein
LWGHGVYARNFAGCPEGGDGLDATQGDASMSTISNERLVRITIEIDGDAWLRFRSLVHIHIDKMQLTDGDPLNQITREIVEQLYRSIGADYGDWAWGVLRELVAKAAD